MGARKQSLTGQSQSSAMPPFRSRAAACASGRTSQLSEVQAWQSIVKHRMPDSSMCIAYASCERL